VNPTENEQQDQAAMLIIWGCSPIVGIAAASPILFLLQKVAPRQINLFQHKE